MRTASVGDLRNHYLKLMKWVAAGEEIVITRRGRPIARLIPESGKTSTAIDWCKSPAVTRDRSAEACLSADESGRVMRDSSGQW